MRGPAFLRRFQSQESDKRESVTWSKLSWQVLCYTGSPGLNPKASINTDRALGEVKEEGRETGRAVAQSVYEEEATACFCLIKRDRRLQKEKGAT